MNMTILHRLAWKELRSLRSFWLALLVLAVGLQGLASWSVGNFWAPPQINFLIPIWMPVMFSLACVSVAFAAEREDGTDQLLCRLAAPPLALWAVKLAINVFGTILLVAVLLPLAWGMGYWSLGGHWQLLRDVWRENGPAVSMSFLALIWQVGFLAWGIFVSLLCRRVLTCVVLATVATLLTPLVVSPILDFLPFRAAKHETFDWTMRLGLIPGVLLLASLWLVQTWDENRWPRFVEWLLGGWRRLTATRERPDSAGRTVENRGGGWRVLVRPFGLCLPDEWLPAWRREARRLLWLEWRQARRVMLFLGLAFGLYLTVQALFVTSGMNLLRNESPFVLALMAFVFGVWSFQAQQSEKHFLAFAGHGVSPTAIWIVKQSVWFVATLATALLTTIVITLWFSRVHPRTPKTIFEPLTKLGYGFQWDKVGGGWIDPQWLRESPISLVVNATLSLGLCFAVGQFVSLLIPRAVTAATIGFVLAGVAFAWQQLTAHLAVPSGLAVLPLIICLLLATFARMTDWLEERNSIHSWLRVVTACLIPSLVTLVGVPLYRVVEIPSLEPYWQVELEEATTPPSAAARQAGTDWLRAVELIDGEPILISRRREGVQEEVEVLQESADLFDLQFGRANWKSLKNQDWVARNAQVLVESARLSQEPDCTFDRMIFESDQRESIQGTYAFRSLTRLAVLLSMAAQSAMADGKLNESLQHILALHRFSRHIQQRGGWNATSAGERVELISWQLLLDWARHPIQTGESLREALGRPGVARRSPLQAVLFPDPRQLILTSNVVWSDYMAAKANLDRRWQEAVWPATWLISERLREERLLDYSAVMARMQLTQFVSESAARGYGETRFVEEHQQGQHGSLDDFLRGTTRTISFVWSDHGQYLVHQRADERGQTELRRRALIATLALRAFHLDHGRWPARWDELVGTYLGSVPVDPWTGQSFDYWPDGFPFDLSVAGRKIAANTPLFLSGGPYRQTLRPHVSSAEENDASPELQWQMHSKWDSQRWPPEKDDYILNSLVCFPLNENEP